MVERSGEESAVPVVQEEIRASHVRGATAERERPRLVQAFSSLHHRDYRLLITSGVVVSVGTWMEQVAQGWLVLELTDSPFYLGLVGFSRSIPVLFFALLGGVLADRFPRKRILLGTRSSIGALAFAMAVLITLDLVNVWLVLAIATLQGVVQAINQPSRQAIVYDLVGGKDLMNAIVLNSAVNNSARVIGPSLAGIVIAFVGIEGAYYCKGLALSLAVVPLALMRVKGAQATEKKAGMVAHMAEGFDYIRKDQTILSLILLALIPMVFAQPYTQLMPVFARDILQIGPQGLGLLMSSAGVGAMVGAFGLAFAGDFRKKGLFMLIAAFTTGFCLAAFSQSQWMPLSLLLMAGVGGMNASYLATNNTLLQSYARDDVRGRVMSVYQLDRGLVPLGSLFAGTMATLFSTPFAVFTMGSIMIVLVVFVLFRMPYMRQIE